jgi:YspA, cpYpsA-related SLOG family
MSNNLRVLVCGGRDYAEAIRLYHVLDMIDIERGIDVVIHGASSGADKLAGEWAESRGKACRVEFADWARHGRAAGPIRNQKLIDEHNPELVIAFPGSRGTADMIRRAKKAGIEVMECTYDLSPP